MKRSCFILLAASVAIGLLSACGKAAAEAPAGRAEGNDRPSEETRSSEARILSLAVAAGDWTLEAYLPETGTDLLLPCYEEDLPALKETSARISLSPGATITPDPAQPRNYTRKVNFIVTAEDGTEVVYAVQPQLRQAPLRPAKPVVLWVDAENSIPMLTSRSAVARAVQDAYDTGFSGIVLDVKSPASGDVLYRSDFLGYCPRLGSTDIPADGDLLRDFIEECHTRGMTLTASLSIMTMPRPATAVGQAYFDAFLSDAVCRTYLPEGIVDMREDQGRAAGGGRAYDFLNPAHPNVHQYVMDMVDEVVRRYDVDGIALDYCRFADVRNDFSDLSRQAFESWSGKAVTHFPEDIMQFSGSDRNSFYPASRFKEWIQWRASLIQGYVRDCRAVIQAARPDVKLEYWSEAWWWDSWMKGQNWASPSAPGPSGTAWASDNYMSTGFADDLDIYHLGAYVQQVYGTSSLYTIEYLVPYGQGRNNGACPLYGSFGAYDIALNFTDATVFCYTHCDGVMIFELGSVRNRWNLFRDAIRKGMRLEGEYE